MSPPPFFAALAATTFAFQLQAPPAQPHPEQEQEQEQGAAINQASMLHRAWMLEVLDLDSAAAAKVYAEVAADDRPGHFLRWVAAARLTELQRLDVAGGNRFDPGELPAVLRPRFTEFDNTLEVESLRRRVAGDPEQVLAELATDAGQLPPLRPLVSVTEDWVVDQIGPSRLDRIRDFRAAQRRRTFSERVFAVRVLRAELEGKGEQAQELRSIYFAQWRPPAAAGDDSESLRRFRHHIDILLTEREWTGYWRVRHRRLRDAVEHLAATEPAAAVALVRRLPYYAERLLAPVPPNDR